MATAEFDTHDFDRSSEDVSPERVADVDSAKYDLRVLYAVIRDPRTNWYVPGLMGVVVLWGIFPVDALPDFFPLFGVLDEAILFLLARAAVYRVVPEEYVDEHATNLSQRSRRRFTARHLIGGVVVLQLSVLLILIRFLGYRVPML